MFGCNKKFHFSKIHFLLTNIYFFDPEIILHSYFQFKSFPEKERERRESPDRREREEEKRTGDRRDRAAQSSALVGRTPLVGAIEELVAFLLLGFGFFCLI